MVDKHLYNEKSIESLSPLFWTKTVNRTPCIFIYNRKIKTQGANNE